MTISVAKLKVAELKAELALRNLPTTGLKAVLAQRLQEAIDKEEQAQAKAPEEPVQEEIIPPVSEGPTPAQIIHHPTEPTSSPSKRQRSHSSLEDEERPKKIIIHSPDRPSTVVHDPVTVDKPSELIPISEATDQSSPEASSDPQKASLPVESDIKNQPEPQAQSDIIVGPNGHHEIVNLKALNSVDRPLSVEGIPELSSENPISSLTPSTLDRIPQSPKDLESQKNQSHENQKTQEITPVLQIKPRPSSPLQTQNSLKTSIEPQANRLEAPQIQKESLEPQNKIQTNSNGSHKQLSEDDDMIQADSNSSHKQISEDEDVVQADSNSSCKQLSEDDDKIQGDSKTSHVTSLDAPSAKPSSDIPSLSPDAKTHTIETGTTPSARAKDLIIPISEPQITSTETGKGSNAPDESDAPSAGPPVTKSLYISNLVRPLTVSQMKKKLSEFGEMETFWIDSIRTHAYVIFNDVSAAKATYKALHQTTPWPPETGKILKLLYVPTEEVQRLIQEEEENTKLQKGRLELHCEREDDGNEKWKFELRMMNSGNLYQQRPRGLASSVPTGLNFIAPINELSIKSNRKDEERIDQTLSMRRSSTIDQQQIEFCKPEQNPIGGPEKWFKKTKTKPHLFWSPAN